MSRHARDAPLPSTQSRGSEPPRVIGRQLAIGFGLVALIAAVMCTMLLSTIWKVSGIVDQMRQDEAAIQGGLKLSTGVREQYIHIAHSLVEGSRSHMGHYERGVRQLDSDAVALARDAPPEVSARIEAVRELTVEMDRVFRDILLPAAERGDVDTVRRGHHRVERISAEAAAHADSVARAVERNMASAHEDARSAVLVGIIMGAICIVAVLSVAVAYTLRLRAAVLRPLEALTVAAQRFGRGDFGHRVGRVGRGELGELAMAFDRMAEELGDREKKLIDKERLAAIGRLAAGVAHEINNPIGIIRGYIKTMLPEATESNLREELEVLDEEAAACQRLTGDLLAYAEKPRLKLASIDMPSFLKDAARRLQEVSDPSGHPLIVEAQDGMIIGDADRLRQVLANLVRNAVQASPANASVLITGRPTPGSGYVFEVLDTGLGVDEEDRSRIFEPFFSKRRSGTGLGLAVCRSIVVGHGGRVEVRSGPDGGARFVVELPKNHGQRIATKRESQ